MHSFGCVPGVRLWFADVSEPSVSSIFKGWMPPSPIGPTSPSKPRAGYKYHASLWLSSFHTLHPAFEDGIDRGFRNVGKPQSDAGDTPKRVHTIFETGRKFEIKETFPVLSIFFSSDLDKILYLRLKKKQYSLYVSFFGIGEVGAILYLRTSINFYP
jgi:hypothetical protein